MIPRMMTQRPFNMHVGIYTKTLCDDLRKCLLITLTLLFVCPGVWGDNIVVNVSQASDFGIPNSSGVYTLANDNTNTYTYTFTTDLSLNGILYVPSESTVIIDLAGHTLSYTGSHNMAFIQNSGTLTIMNTGGGAGAITGGSSGNHGGGIRNYGTLYFTGGTLSGNTASYGGGIYNENGASLYIQGGTITNNTATNLGGGVCNDNGTIYMQGSPTITGNLGSSQTDNVFLYNTIINISGALSGEGKVGVKRGSLGTFTTGATSVTDYLKFTSDNNNYIITKTGDNNARLQTPWDALQDKITAAQEATGDAKIVTLDQDYTAISGDGPLEISGTVTLDLKGFTINRGLGSSATTNGNVITVTSTGNLTIKDTSTGGTITGGFNSGNGGGIINEGSLTIEGGSITSNKSTGNGAGIYHTGTALTMKGAPTITSNTKSSAANNVYLANGKTITIGDGGLTGSDNSIGITMQTRGFFTTGSASATNYQKFSSDDIRLSIINTADNNAKLQTPWDALQTLLDGGSTVTLTQTYNAISGLDGPLVVNNNVTLDLATFNINRNLSSAATNGYVIKVESGKTLTIQGTTGQIKGGYNNGNGGGIYNAGTVDLQGGIITGNKVTTNYNGAGIYNAGTLKMQGAPQVKSNTIGSSTASNIYLLNPKTITIDADLTGSAGNIGVTLQSIRGTFTTGAASAVNTYFSSDDTRLQVVADGNEAKLQTPWDALQTLLNGGGTVTLTQAYNAISGIDGPLTVNNDVTLDLATYTIDRKLTGAIDNGYVIKVNSGARLTITGSGTIKGGYNTENGGGIYNAGTLNLNGGNITQNYVSTEKKGAGVYNEGTLTMAGSVSVNNNKVNGSSGTLNNIYLTTGQKIDITAALTGTSGITHADGHAVFTTSLSGNGSATNFAADINGYGIGLDASGNAIVGQSYSISTDYWQDTGISMTAATVKTSAVEGECVSVTFPNYGQVPKSLTYTYHDETHPETKYLKRGGTITFTMPAYNVAVYTTYTNHGNHCGNSSDDGGRNVKWIIDNGSLIFTAEDGSRTMNVYASANAIPWRGYNYTSFSFPSNVTNITPYAFYGSGLTSASIHKDVVSIGEDAFGKCTSLTSITVHEDNTSYSSSDGILYNKTGTTLICYPAGKTGTSHTVGASVTGIATHAFAYNPYLNAVTIPTATTSIGAGAFNGCTGLTTITADGSNTIYSTNEGILYNKAGTTLICYPAGKNATSFSVPNTVTAIGDYAFFMQTHLERVTIPSTVTSIGNSAFQNCSALSLVYALRTEGVPTGGTSMFDGNANPRKIMVIKGKGSDYKAAANWSNYQNQIYEMDLANATVELNYYVYEYDGTVHEPTVTVTFEGITLNKDQDYAVMYSGNNISVGEVTVTVTGINNYAGTSNSSAKYNIQRKITFTNVTGNYATYYANEDLAIPSGFTASTFTDGDIDWDNGKLTPTQVNFIKAKTPVLLYKNGGVNGTYHVNAGTGTNYTAHSDFMGVLASTPYSTVKGSGSAVYVLKNDKFLRVSNTDDILATQSLPAHRCYLLRPIGKSSPNFVPSYLSIIIGNSEVTKIEISSENGENVDGRVWYTLDGRRLQGKPTQKGIYISNGKKIHIK